MERAEWLKHEREKAEKLYDLFSPHYEFDEYPNETHLEKVKY